LRRELQKVVNFELAESPTTTSTTRTTTSLLQAERKANQLANKKLAAVQKAGDNARLEQQQESGEEATNNVRRSVRIQSVGYEIDDRPIPEHYFESFGKFDTFLDETITAGKLPTVGISMDASHKNSLISSQLNDWLISKRSVRHINSFCPQGFQNEKEQGAGKRICFFIAAAQLTANVFANVDVEYENSVYPLIQQFIRLYVQGTRALEPLTLYSLSEEVLSAYHKRRQQCAIEIMGTYFLPDPPSILLSQDTNSQDHDTNSLFKVHSMIKCSECAQHRRDEFIFNKFLDMRRVDLLEPTINLQKLIDTYLQPLRQAVSDEILFCASCGAEDEFVTEVMDVPQQVVALSIHRYDDQGNKVECNLTLDPFIEIRGNTYELIGAIYHSGVSMYSGHYTTYVSRIAPDGIRRFAEMDDLERITRQQTIVKENHLSKNAQYCVYATYMIHAGDKNKLAIHDDIPAKDAVIEIQNTPDNQHGHVIEIPDTPASVVIISRKKSKKPIASAKPIKKIKGKSKAPVPGGMMALMRKEPKKKATIIFVYPSHFLAKNTISMLDTDRELLPVDSKKYLNDNIIEFRMQYHRLENFKQSQDDFYIFSTQFYTKLCSREGYEGVRRWGKPVKDLFKKEFIYVPINTKDDHWSLVVIIRPYKICYVSLLLFLLFHQYINNKNYIVCIIERV
jgi:Ulp1 protease family, C-terminal catalytic domain/Ubiquitin carboxyl-terminal hydrolase